MTESLRARVVEDLTGKRIGRLTVVCRSRKKSDVWAAKKYPHLWAWWLCACDCGRSKTLRQMDLTGIRVTATSCGCDKSAQSARRAREWTRKNLTASRIASASRARRASAELSDGYVRRLIVDKSGIQSKNVSVRMIDATRAYLKVRRLIKESER